MRHTSLLAALPFLALTLPAQAEPMLLAMLKEPSKQPSYRPPPSAASAYDRVRMEVARVLPSQHGPVVLLRDAEGRRTMPIWVGHAEARAIDAALRSRTPMRPGAHDLLAETMRRLGGRLVDVEVRALRNNVFYGSAHVTTARREALTFDARPSDLIALALRADAPIYVRSAVLEVAGLEAPARIKALEP